VVSNRTWLASQSYDKIIFLGAPLAILLVLIFYPTYHLWRLAFSNFDITYMAKPVFVGVDNFTQVVVDPYFWAAFKNTLIISGAAVTIEFFVGLGMALFLNGKIFWGMLGRLLKAILVVPIMIPPVVIGLNFKLIFDNFGPINGFLRMLGLQSVQWLGTSLTARISIVIADVWQWSPFLFIIFLAGLQTIPQDFYDAAKVDGAGSWKIFRHITWPMLIPSAVTALLLRVIDALKIFDVVYMVTAGGPSFATEVLSLNIYRTAFRFGSLGYASSLAVVLFLVLMLFVAIIIRITRLSERMEWK